MNRPEYFEEMNDSFRAYVVEIEKENTQLTAFKNLVSKMRRAQRNYFKALPINKQVLLTESKEFEKKVDLDLSGQRQLF